MKFNGVLRFSLILINCIISLSSLLKSKKRNNKYFPALITIKVSQETPKHSNKRHLNKASSRLLIKNSDSSNKTNLNKNSYTSQIKHKFNSKPNESSKLNITKNTTLNDSLTTTKSTNNAKSKNNTILIRNEFYDICFQVFNYSESSVSCEKAEMLEEITFNCDERKFEELKSKLNKGPYKDSDKVIKIINQTSFTMEMRKDIFKYSSCVKDTPLLELDFGIDFLNRNQMRVNLQNGFSRGEEKFSKDPEPIFSFSPLGKEMDFKVLIGEINKSQRLLRNSFAGENEKEKLNELEDIELSEKDDLRIEYAEILSENFSGIKSDKKHKRLYLCAKNDKNSAYHFLVDATTRDPAKEKIIIQSAKIQKDLFYKDKSLKTSIRVIYINKTENCVEDRFDLEKIKEEKIKQFLGQKKIGKGSIFNAIPPRVPDENSSFKNFIVAIQRYALDNENFGNAKDSGFFAKGFFNYLCSMNSSGKDNDKDQIGSKKEMFESYFKDESDEVFMNNLIAQMIN